MKAIIEYYAASRLNSVNKHALRANSNRFRQQRGRNQKWRKSTQVKELTYEDTLLGELLKAEGFDVEGQTLPQSTDIIWDGINKSITRLYSQWNDLEPLLMEEESIFQGEITHFEEGLDNLTVFSTEQNYFAAMTAANQLTGNLANFMASFADNKIVPLYKLKFHLRSIVLQAATDNYPKAQESLDYIKEQSLS